MSPCKVQTICVYMYFQSIKNLEVWKLLNYYSIFLQLFNDKNRKIIYRNSEAKNDLPTLESLCSNCPLKNSYFMRNLPTSGCSSKHGMPLLDN